MLGEDHSLLKEFPEHETTINKLKDSNESFLNDYKEYDELDAQIRHLELNNNHIEDTAMHELKHRRRVLKDRLYKQILSA